MNLVFAINFQKYRKSLTEQWFQRQQEKIYFQESPSPGDRDCHDALREPHPKPNRVVSYGEVLLA